jgi:hypothetical protein
MYTLDGISSTTVIVELRGEHLSMLNFVLAQRLLTIQIPIIT